MNVPTTSLPHGNMQHWNDYIESIICRLHYCALFAYLSIHFMLHIKMFAEYYYNIDGPDSMPQMIHISNTRLYTTKFWFALV